MPKTQHATALYAQWVLCLESCVGRKINSCRGATIKAYTVPCTVDVLACCIADRTMPIIALCTS